MNPFVETLYVLQRCTPTHAPVSPGPKTSLADLRASVPPPMLAHFDRLAALGRPGVAEVRQGVCGACHLRLPAALTAGGDPGDDLQLCENCGAYLIFPAPEVTSGIPAAARPRRRYRAAVVA
jgi:hypothetical protein